MPTVGKSRLVRDVHVPQLDTVVHGRRQKEVARVVESHLPDRLSVLLVSGCGLARDEVPDLNFSIARSSSEHVASRVEGASSNPVTVAFSTHYKVSIRDRPQFPSSIVGGSGDDVFLRVVTDGGYSHQVAFKRFLIAEVGAHCFVALI